MIIYFLEIGKNLIYYCIMQEEKIGKILKNRSWTIATSESCTGGLISSRLTDVAGSSDYITLNFVTYANVAKINVLGVSAETISQFGAVSEQCVVEMALGTIKATGANVALCTSGVAGPAASENKPAGLLWIAVAIGKSVYTKCVRLKSSIERIQMKKLFADEALDFLYSMLVKQ